MKKLIIGGGVMVAAALTFAAPAMAHPDTVTKPMSIDPLI